MDFFSNFDFYAYLVLPLLIFLARVFDQSMGILRIIFATKGYPSKAFVFGFFESFVWLLAIGHIMTKIDNLMYYFVYAGGFATGNVVGMYIEKRLSIGLVLIRVVFQKNSEDSITLLRAKGYRLTVFDAMGIDQPVKGLFSVIKRAQVNDFINKLIENNPTAFYTIEEVKQAKEGYLTTKRNRLNPFNR